MKIPTKKEREAVLNKLREAVVFQIALWNAGIEISTVTELSHRDLDDLLDW